MIYNGYAEAEPGAAVMAWLAASHRRRTPPTEESYTPREWEKPHVPNMHRHAGGLPSLRLDACQRPPPDRRPATTRPGRREAELRSDFDKFILRSSPDVLLGIIGVYTLIDMKQPIRSRYRLHGRRRLLLPGVAAGRAEDHAAL